jgi:hypothetical protein
MGIRKNRAAVTLARRSAKARLKSLTPEQRSDQARRAAMTRWRQAKPGAYPPPSLYWCLFGLDESNQPFVLFASQDKEEVRQRARTDEFRDQAAFIDSVEYNPTRFRLLSNFQPNVKAQLSALETILKEPNDR